MSRKYAIMILAASLLSKNGANNLSSCQPSQLTDCNKDKDGIAQLHLDTSFCSLSSWFQKISNPSFECSKQDVETTDGIVILLKKRILLIQDFMS